MSITDLSELPSSPEAFQDALLHHRVLRGLQALQTDSEPPVMPGVVLGADDGQPLPVRQRGTAAPASVSASGQTQGRPEYTCTVATSQGLRQVRATSLDELTGELTRAADGAAC